MASVSSAACEARAVPAARRGARTRRRPPARRGRHSRRRRARGRCRCGPRGSGSRSGRAPSRPAPLLLLGRGRELRDRQGPGGDDEQRLDRPREAVDGVLYEAEAFHTVMGSKGLPGRSGPPRACVARGGRGGADLLTRGPVDLVVEGEAAARAERLRKRSRKRESGGYERTRWRSDGSGGTAASDRSATSCAGSCWASGREGAGASGAAPRRKKRSDSASSRSSATAAARKRR